MKLNNEKIEKQSKTQNICEVETLKTVEGKYKMIICENKNLNNESK